MSSNKTLLKADMAVADLTTNGGKLQPEQANVFIRKLLQQPTILRQARTVVMNSPQRNVNKIQFSKRILRAATSGVALDTAAVDGAFNAATEKTARAKPTTEQITLNTKEIIAEVHLPYDVVEDNIERGNIGLATDAGGTPQSGGIVDTIMTLIAERAALDLEELALLGDTATGAGDPFLDLTDGWLKRITSNVLAAGGSPVSRQLLTNAVKLLGSQYRRNRPAMRHFLSTENEIDYRETIAQRETATGDSMTSNLMPVFAAGVPVEGAALMPAASGLITHPLNLLWGIQRNIHVETDKDISARMYKIVLTLRCDFQVEEELAAVKITGMG